MEQVHHLHGGTIQTVHVQLLVQNEESNGIKVNQNFKDCLITINKS